MSKDLTDADTFTPAIHVPEGLDSRDDAAGDVELVAQGLANRTRYVRNHAAYRDEPNTLTGQNTFTQTIVGGSPAADQSIFHTSSDPPSLGTTWRIVFNAKYAGGLYASTYTGSNLTDAGGAYLICTNAEWVPGTSQWRQLTKDHDSIAVIWHRGKVRISRVAAGVSAVASWATWPTTFAVGKGAGGGAGDEGFIAGDFYCAGTSQAGTVRATNAMKVTAGDYDYTTARVRTFPLDLATACGDVIRLANGTIRTHGVTIIPDDPQPLAVADDGMGTVVLPLRLSAGTAIQSVQVMVKTVSGSGALQCQLAQRAPPTWGGAGVPPFSSLVSASSPATPGTYVVTLTFPAVTFDPAYEYQVVFLANMPGDTLLAARVVNWGDPGLRNMLQGA